MSYNVDPWYKSKRIIASVVLVISLIASMLGYTIGEGSQEIITDSLIAMSGAIAALLIVWSKIREAAKVKEDETETETEKEG